MATRRKVVLRLRSGATTGEREGKGTPTSLLASLRLLLGSVSGFTLIELMLVIIILGILAGLIVPRIMEDPDKAKVVKARFHHVYRSVKQAEYDRFNARVTELDYAWYLRNA